MCQLRMLAIVGLTALAGCAVEPRACSSAADCSGGQTCQQGACISAPAGGCHDGNRDGTETDVDCGGSACAPCTSGRICGAGADCASGVCAAGQCATAACDDGVKNGDETDLDCGGACPAGCEVDQGCAAASDCQSGVCVAQKCVSPACNDAVKNGTETDMNCGGSCEPCADGKGCAGSSDCSSKVCTDGTCIAPACGDAITNGDETDVDCGSSCDPCGDGEGCAIGIDCASQVCTDGTCIAPTCSDEVKNGDETDLNCGGSCEPCADDKGCAGASDCLSQVCTDGTCIAPSCGDGVHNGDETDLDCGVRCDPCGDGKGCAIGVDCASYVCTDGICIAPTCSDGVENGDETDLNCGGSCEPCADGKGCAGGVDCLSQVCTDGTCFAPSCGDGIDNGAETDLDCGGGCEPCGDGEGCAIGGDCASYVCTDGTCIAPTCSDGVENGDETDLNCGGGCDPCGDGKGCSGASDCLSQVCTDGTCIAPTCGDGVPNGEETGLDCGGGCDPCGDGKGCLTALDCTSRVCTAGTCIAPACDDGVANGEETDLDCGAACPKCGAGKGCSSGLDCASNECGRSRVCVGGGCGGTPINITTLGVMYGTPIAGASLASKLNSATAPVAITGRVMFATSDCTLDNPNLCIVGNGSITSSSQRLRLKRFSRLEGLTAVTPVAVSFPTDSTASGVIANIGTMAGVEFGVPLSNISGTVPVNLNVVFDTVNASRFWGAVNGLTLRNVTTGYTGWHPIALAGSYNTIEYCTIDAGEYEIAAKFYPLFGVPHSKRNVVRYNTFSRAREEAVGWDCLGPASHRLAGSISTIDGNTITVSAIHGPVYSPFTTMYGPPLEGSNSKGMYVLLGNGVGRGRYFEIIAQSAATLTLDTSTFSLDGAQVGDLVTINIAFVENEYYGNTVELDATSYSYIGYGQHVGFSLWGSCYGNSVHDNVVNAYGTPSYYEQSCGFCDTGVILFNGGSYSYALNSRNVYRDNRTNNTYEDLRLGTWFYNDSYYVNETGYYEGLGKITDTDLGIMSMEHECSGHVASPRHYVSIHNVLDMLWGANNTVAPSVIYDERYQSALSGQPALGGNTSTTFR